MIQNNIASIGRIYLDSISREDLSFMLAWRNDPRVFKWCRQNDLINEVAHLKWFEQSSLDPTIKMYAIRTDLFNIVGVCGFTSIDNLNKRAEFSLYIGPQHWGNGIGKASLYTLCSHGFNSYGFNIIWGETFEGNPAEKMFIDLGFKKEGTRREFYFRDGKFIDAHLYSIKKDELRW